MMAHYPNWRSTISHAFEQRMQDLAAIPTLLVNEPFPQIAIQILEPLAHATEIASEFIGELDDIPGSLQRLTLGERIQPPVPGSRDLSVQPISLNHQLGNATLRANVGSLDEPNQPIDDDREPAFSGGRARLQQRRYVADRIGRCSGQFAFLLGRARGKSALEKTVTQPFCDIAWADWGSPSPCARSSSSSRSMRSMNRDPGTRRSPSARCTWSNPMMIGACSAPEADLLTKRCTAVEAAAGRRPIPTIRYPDDLVMKIWSGKRDSNSRPQPWQGCALPTELFPRRAPSPKQTRNCRAGSRGVKKNRPQNAAKALSGASKFRTSPQFRPRQPQVHHHRPQRQHDRDGGQYQP